MFAASVAEMKRAALISVKHVRRGNPAVGARRQGCYAAAAGANRGSSMVSAILQAARRGAVGAGFLAALAAAGAAAQEKDRHAGYYYPPATVTETYQAEATTVSAATRVRRIGLIAAITNRSASSSFAPTYVMFVKGADAEKLIIIGMGSYVSNIYQARALLAQLTAQARFTEAFKEVDAEHRLTFLDLLKMLGFDQVTVSDGKSFTLQIAIK
jgi:hypothetical protein